MNRRSNLVPSLRKIFGSHGYSEDPDLAAAFGRDLSPFLMLRAKRHAPFPVPRAVVFPENETQVCRFLKWSVRARVPVVPFGGGSGVCGAAMASPGSVVLSLGRMNRIVDLDPISGLVRVQPGVYGPELEKHLNHEGFTLGHFPASFEISTVGGWLASRGAGQSSTKYGKIEDMVSSVRVVLPDGRIVQTVPAPRSATGSSLVQLFVGSEGTLGVIVEAGLRVWPKPEEKIFQSYSFDTFVAGVEAVRRLIQKGYRPAVVRLYDEAEAAWYGSSLKWEGGGALLVLVWEGTKGLTFGEAEMGRREIEGTGKFTGEIPGRRWEETRFQQVHDYRKIMERPDPIMAETIEIACLWKDVAGLYEEVRNSVPGTLCTAHISHAYQDGVGIYFTFLIQADSMKAVQKRYHALWKAVMGAAVRRGAAISHHHGIGTLRAPWMKRSLGEGFQVLKRLKKSLDPAGILNPGKLGL
ncbi:MAG: FAD-binding oxidoreductase [Nitrospirae bacterium]|nr:FAD-binding oxidoreductase [Nitrospirota bacterium]